jgi:hypothetical protein
VGGRPRRRAAAGRRAHPEQFATMVVEENFADAVEMVAAELLPDDA